MEYKWNINKLKELLKEENIIFASCQDEKQKLLRGIDIYQLQLAISYNEEIPFIDNDYSIKNIEIIEEKRDNNLQELNEKTDIIKSLFFREKISIPDVYFSGETKLTIPKSIELVKTLPFMEARVLEKLIKEKQLFIAPKKLSIPDKGACLFIPGISYQLVYAKHEGVPSDIVYLSHELGHAKQNILVPNTLDTFNNQQSSILREISSEISELISLFYLKGKINEQDRLAITYDFICFHEEEIKRIISGINDNVEYIYSELISIYLFILYRYNYSEYEKLIKKFYELAGSSSDKEIYQSLNIDSNKIKDSFERFKQDYIEEVDKIKKLI